MQSAGLMRGEMGPDFDEYMNSRNQIGTSAERMPSSRKGNWIVLFLQNFSLQMPSKDFN